MHSLASHPCVACGHAGVPPPQYGAGTNARYHPCSHCGTLHLRPLPVLELNEAFECESAAETMARTDDLRLGFLGRKLDVLSPGRAPHAARLLDVGCSAGRLMRLASERGWAASGIEMSAALASQARAHNPGSTVTVGDILQLDTAQLGQFEAITALDVIEHVLDPNTFLLKLRELLVPGGQILLHTPNTSGLQSRLRGDNWNMRIPEYHFHLFTLRGMRALLSRNGYEVQRLTSSSGSGTETGRRAIGLAVKEAVLGLPKLGNAIVVTARSTR